LLNLNKNIITILTISSFILLLSGCSSRSSNYYSSSDYKNSSAYKKIQNQTMRNSDAMHRATMRPYVIAGKKYYPTMTKVGSNYEGIASWYGPNFHAKKTSNGEIYNMYAMTAASKTLPMNTMVEVYNKENGKSTIVRINDRGPFVDGRIIDLSNKAAHAIDMVKKGTAQIKLTVVGFNGKIATTSKEKEQEVSVGNYFLQVGAFSRLEGAKITRDKYNKQFASLPYKAIIKQFNVNGKWLNRVWISGFRSEDELKDFKSEHNLDHAMVIAE